MSTRTLRFSGETGLSFEPTSIPPGARPTRAARPARPALSITFALAAAVSAAAAPARAAEIGVLSDGRQAAFLSLLGDSSAAARLALQGDGHQIVALPSLTPAVMNSVDVVWLPVLSPAQSYTAQERVNLVQHLVNGGRVVFIGDADVFNFPDNSFLAAFNTTKRIGNLNAPLSPALPGHPVVTGPHGSVQSVGENAGYGLFNGIGTMADVIRAATGPGTFAGFMDTASGFTGAGRLAVICDSSIFGQLLAQEDHLALLRNTVKWAAAAPGYTPSGTGVVAGPMTGACGACLQVTATFESVLATGETAVQSLGAGRCRLDGIPDAALPTGFVGFGFALTTGASHGGTVGVTVAYDPAELAEWGIDDEATLRLLWLHPTDLMLIDATADQDASANRISGVAAGTGAFVLGAVVTPFPDCNQNGLFDACELAEHDCNGNELPDDCDIAGGLSQDIDGNGVPDECDPDCNGNGLPDGHDIASGIEADCNGNGVPDACELADGTVQDCNGNGAPDECDIAGGLEPDCNGNSVPDGCEIAAGTTPDCNDNGVPDSCDIAGGTSADCDANGVPDECDPDCNGNGVPDACDLTGGTSPDCNANGIPDECDIASGTSPDCNGNGVPDSCDLAGGAADCNGNGVPDACDIALGTSPDCNANSVPDSCDIAGGADPDCNANGVPDSCDIASGVWHDCDENGIPDICDVQSGTPDCNQNGIPDACDLDSGNAPDCNANGVPDSCDIAAGAAPDCNANGVPDSCDIAGGTAPDCNGNGVPDSCDVSAGGASQDCNGNATPDECETDCNGNGVPDDCDIASGAAPDCNGNGIPDSCDIAAGTSADCDANGVPDECDPDCNGNGQPDRCDIAAGIEADCNANDIPDACELAGGTAPDCNGNGIPDSCDIAAGTSADCDGNGVPDECDPDCNGNGQPDACDIASGASADCNGNGVPDSCDLAAGTAADCNGNGVPDSCDIASGVAVDCNGNGVPDDCDLASGAAADCNGNGIPDSCDIATGFSIDCNQNGVPDTCDPPYFADAGPPIRLCPGQMSPALGGPVVASGSNPPYQYEWRILSGPAGGQIVSPHTERAWFVGAADGEYVVELRVRDASTPPCVRTDTTTITVASMSVTAGGDQNIGLGTTSAPLGATIAGGVAPHSFAWTFEPGCPSADPGQFTGGGAGSASPTFTPAVPGTYVLRVTATDSNAPPCAVSDTVEVRVTQVLFSVGADFTMCVQRESAPLALTVSAPGIAPLSYAWSIEAGSPNTDPAQFTGAGPQAAHPTFRPTSLGTYTLRARVRDAASPPSEAAATLHVTVVAMTVDAGPDAVATVGGAGLRLSPVVEGGTPPRVFRWTIEEGSPSLDPRQFTDPHDFAASPLFKPSAAGGYTLRLFVRDSATPPCEATDIVTIRTSGMAVDAGPDFATPIHRPSRPVGAYPIVAGGKPPYRFEWRIIGGPDRDPARLSDAAAEHPVFMPTATGIHILRVRVTDSESPPATAEDDVVVEAYADELTLPINVEGRAFVSLRLSAPHARAEIRLSDARTGGTLHSALRDDGAAADFAGLAVTPGLARRVQGELTPNDRPVAVVAMYYAAEEAVGLDAASLRLFRWQSPGGPWRPVSDRPMEEGPYPARPGRAEVGRQGIDPSARCVWAVVDALGEFAIGIPAGGAGPVGLPGIGSFAGGAGGLCGAGMVPALAVGACFGLTCIRARRGRRAPRKRRSVNL